MRKNMERSSLDSINLDLRVCLIVDVVVGAFVVRFPAAPRVHEKVHEHDRISSETPVNW